MYSYMTKVILIVFFKSPFVPSSDLDEVFTYNPMALMSLRSRSRIKAFVLLTRADHYIHNYIRSLLNII